MSTLTVQPTGRPCGAALTGVDLSQPLSDAMIADIRAAWLAHHVVFFPDQKLSDDDLERFALSFGEFGDDVFFGPIPGREHIAAIRREAQDTSPIFAESWHSDWSFQKHPPIATVLYALDVPPQGGDTLFANQHLALARMPAELRDRLEGLSAIHSAVLAYSPDGLYGDAKNHGSMDIRPSEVAREHEVHPLIRPHPETGEPGIFSAAFAYIVGFEGMSDQDAKPLLETPECAMAVRQMLNRRSEGAS